MPESRGIYLLRKSIMREERAHRGLNLYDTKNCQIETHMIARERGIPERIVKTIRREVRRLYDAAADASRARWQR